MTKKQVIQLINNYWKFDNDQDNLSSWHDKQDLINEIEKLTSTDVSQQSELLELVTEIANNKQDYSNTRHKLWAKKLISSNCG